MTPLAVRLRASLLSGLFLLGALGVPLADGAFFHLAGHDPYAGVTHVEPAGSTHHADRCTLAQPIAAQRAALGSAGATHAELPLVAYAIAPAAALPSDAAPVTLQHSRAPPA